MLQQIKQKATENTTISMYGMIIKRKKTYRAIKYEFSH